MKGFWFLSVDDVQTVEGLGETISEELANDHVVEWFEDREGIQLADFLGNSTYFLGKKIHFKILLRDHGQFAVRFAFDTQFWPKLH